MTKKNEIIQFGKDNIESKFELKLSQTDLVEAAVSEKEDELYANLEAIQSDVKALNKEYKENDLAVTHEAKDIAVGKYKRVCEIAQKALRVMNKNIIVFPEYSGMNTEKKTVFGTVYVSSATNSKGYAGGIITLVQSDAIPFTKELNRLRKNQESILGKLTAVREIESELNEKISNIDRLLRKAKAQITRNAVKGTGLAKLIPSLTEK